MKPVNRLIRGDTLEVLKKIEDSYFDVGITSPPYNKGEKHKGWLVKNVKYDENSDDIPEEAYQRNQTEVLNEIFRVTKSGGSFFYNHKLRWDKGIMTHPMEWLSETKWMVRQEIIWDRVIAANIRGWRFWQVEERIYWLYRPGNASKIGKELESRHAKMTSIWKIMPENKNKHPAPFPLALPTRAIYSILDGKKGIVLDPYIGSGTTAVAARLLGSDYVGIDVSGRYLKIARKRLENIEQERKKLDKELDKHVVEKTFKERKKEKKGNRQKSFSI